MTTTVSARDIKIRDLSQKFGLQKSDDPDFFNEWRDALPELAQGERDLLYEIRADYDRLLENDLLESAVKMLIISPLLRMAGMYRAPFYFNTEKSVEITSQDDSTIVRGRIDALVFEPEFWVLAIEAKNTNHVLATGLPQLLAYMLDAPRGDCTRPVLGWLTNGRDSQFVKLRLPQSPNEMPQYAISQRLLTERDGEFEQVLQILKKIAASFRELPRN